MSASWGEPHTDRSNPLLVALVCAVFLACLLLADHVGEMRRCDSLRAQHSPATATYCPGGTR